MKKILAILVALGLVLGLGMALQVQAAPSAPKKPIVYPGKTQGAVTFDHAKHAVACNTCHAKPFKMKANGSGITMDAITAGQFCGTCHDGKKAFSAKDKASCTKCHKK